ncbi:competence protein CoiA [Dictyobacter aurantiacus]|uniref:Competence protein CoiA n=1 Tax=Dictyobacter aurantiacus TaxID=1936993 RepID=A0A401Z881_9CHLR|nr:competence protein CoiA family protein [Dictyobacter aurantiacus]GCE03064.1 hypothetical protein KDAU_03930 [Dictyobacter aurantiacus]
MLVAYGPDQRTVIAGETPFTQLQQWSRNHQLYCPNCRGVVHIRGGAEKRTQVHFAHQKGECAWSTEAESIRHAQGKLVLAQWLRQQYPQASISLEKRLPEPNRIADVFLQHTNRQQWAIEFQCAPLDIEEWKMRHQAYRKAGITDCWIIGNNRREKQEAFIEALLVTNRELLFLDPLVNPPWAWLRWPITRQQALERQRVPAAEQAAHPQSATIDGWVGRTGYGMTILGTLNEIQLDRQARLIHPTRVALEQRNTLLQEMETATAIDEQQLVDYLRPALNDATLRLFVIPLLHAYRLDPELARRYNYGRGLPDQPLRPGDQQRIDKAGLWLRGLVIHGYTQEKLQLVIREFPFAGPYAAFRGYAETLLALASQR